MKKRAEVKIFLAHANEDSERVKELYRKLKSAGYSPWLDKIDLIPGQQWKTEIPKALKQSDIFIACLSKTSVQKRGYIQSEFRLALQQASEMPAETIYLIPLKLDECSIPELEQPQYGVRLSDYHWLDYWEEGAFEKLLTAIESVRGEIEGKPVEEKLPEREEIERKPVVEKAPEREETSLEIWKRKLYQFEKQEAITANPELKFELEEKIKECRRKIRELENREPSPEPRGFEIPTISRRRLLQLGGTVAGVGGTIILADNLSKWISSGQKGNNSTQKGDNPAQKPNLSQMTFEVVTVNKKGEITTKESKTAEYFDEDLGKGIMLKMVDIPAGTFLMGSPDNEKGRLVRESPQRRVNVPTFFMGETLVTQAQWRAVASLPPVKKALELNPSLFKGDELPVERVSWQDAIEFCARLSRYTKKNYRLPSEPEWEYACRAGTTTPFHFGETITSKLANYLASVVYQEEPAGKYRGKTTPVKTFSQNAFGLYDMHGNLWEWCLDPWHDNYEGAPKDESVWDNENKDNIYHNILDSISLLIRDRRSRIIRGGACYNDPRYCRSACRSYYGYVNYPVGFRPVFSVQDS